MADANTEAGPFDAEWAAESNTTQILIVVTTFNFLALACVGARLYARVWVLKAPHMEDWMMIPTAICSVGGGWVVFVIQAQYGLGKHYRTIDPDDYVKFQHAAFFSVIVSSAAGMMFLKVSIALNLLRLSPSRWYRWSLWATIGLTVAYCVGGTFPFFLNCQPMSGYWDKSAEPVCMPLGMFIQLGLLNTSLNIFTDVVLATLPVPIVWRLQMKLKLRLYVLGILSLGYLAVAMGVVKAVYQIAFGSDMDKTFHYHIFVWGFLQIQMGIIAACAPALRPLLAKILRLTSHDDYRNEGDSPSQMNGTAVRVKHRRTMRSGMGPRRDQYELDERLSGDEDCERALPTLGVPTLGVATVAAAFYQGSSGKGSGSQERILQGDPPGAEKGIMKTIEVIVK